MEIIDARQYAIGARRAAGDEGVNVTMIEIAIAMRRQLHRKPLQRKGGESQA